jgi:hypothetical protein
MTVAYTGWITGLLAFLPLFNVFKEKKRLSETGCISVFRRKDGEEMT